MHGIYEAPISTAWFQKRLDAIARDYPGIRLRIVWGPSQVEAKVIDKDGNQRVYRKYPLLGMQTQEYHVGNYYRRDGIVIAYQKIGELVPSNVRLADLAVPHIEYVNHALHLFIIEKKRGDESARETWAEKREISRQTLGMDIFGSFPKEGVWDWFEDISAHYNGCCDLAASHNVRCRGLYREPDGRDLDDAAARLKEWNDLPNLEDKTPLITQMAKDWTKAVTEWEDNKRLEILKEARECTQLDRIAHERTRVVGGVNPPLHRTEY